MLWLPLTICDFNACLEIIRNVQSSMQVKLSRQNLWHKVNYQRNHLDLSFVFFKKKFKKSKNGGYSEVLLMEVKGANFKGI